MKDEGLWTKYLQLNFTPHQLQQLNIYFSDLENCQDFRLSGNCNWIEGEVDKLIQYLCQVVGSLDSRFSSEFLVRLEPNKCFVKNSNSLFYLIRLDKLSNPQIINLHNKQEQAVALSLEFNDEKIPNGFARIKMNTKSTNQNWMEFITDDSYLRRDKIQKKYIELLEEATAPESNTIQEVNSPGKIVDAETLHHILNVPPSEQVFYTLSKEVKRMDSSELRRKFRIEVMESQYLIKLRIGFLSSNLDEDVDVILILAIGLQGWPDISDYPHRIPLLNLDFLLHHQAATTGFYVTTAAINPQSTFPHSKNRSLLWQFSFPSIECCFFSHFSDFSSVARVANIVYNVILNLRRTTTGGQTVGKFVIKTLLWYELEKWSKSKFWSSSYLSYHVICILDELVNCLRQQYCSSYFIPEFNVLMNSFRSLLSLHMSDDYKEDADLLETFVHRIHALSSSELTGLQQTSNLCSYGVQNENLSKYESVLMTKWNSLLTTMLNNRRKADNKVIGFASKQMEYITYIFRAMLITKSVIIYAEEGKLNRSYSLVDYSSRMLKRRMDLSCTIKLDDTLYIVSSIFDQAKEYSMKMPLRWDKKKKSSIEFDQKLETAYSEAKTQVLEEIRQNFPAVNYSDLDVVKFILRIVYENAFALKILRKIMKPYMREFFLSTHDNCWFLDEWKNRIYNEEFVALRIFSRLVSSKQIKFKFGLLDALKKGWDWADEMIQLSIKLQSGVNIIFKGSDGQITRRYLIFSDEEITRLKKIKLGSYRNGYRNVVTDLYGMLKFDDHELFCEDEIPIYILLRDHSPITQVINCNKRRGLHHGLGTIVLSLVNLGKFTLLQEITGVLPEEKRKQALERIQKALKEKHRLEREQWKIRGICPQHYRLLPDFHTTCFTSYCHSYPHYQSLFGDSQSSSEVTSSTNASSIADDQHKETSIVFYNPTNVYKTRTPYQQYFTSSGSSTNTSYLMSLDRNSSFQGETSCSLSTFELANIESSSALATNTNIDNELTINSALSSVWPIKLK